MAFLGSIILAYIAYKITFRISLESLLKEYPKDGQVSPAAMMQGFEAGAAAGLVGFLILFGIQRSSVRRE